MGLKKFLVFAFLLVFVQPAFAGNESNTTHDVGVGGLSPLTVAPGELFSVVALLENHGNYSKNVNVGVSFTHSDSSCNKQFSKAYSLLPLGSKQLYLDTSLSCSGNYSVALYAELAGAVDSVPENNRASSWVLVADSLPEYRLWGLSFPSETMVGKTEPLYTNLTNYGSKSGNAYLTFQFTHSNPSCNYFSSQYIIFLKPGETIDVFNSVSLTCFGNYSINVSVNEFDSNPFDNSVFGNTFASSSLNPSPSPTPENIGNSTPLPSPSASPFFPTPSPSFFPTLSPTFNSSGGLVSSPENTVTNLPEGDAGVDGGVKFILTPAVSGEGKLLISTSSEEYYYLFTKPVFSLSLTKGVKYAVTAFYNASNGSFESRPFSFTAYPNSLVSLKLFQTTSLRASVVDSSGSILPYSLVSVSCGGVKKTGYTDEKGELVFSGLPLGNCLLSASKDGAIQETNVNVSTASNVVVVKIELGLPASSFDYGVLALISTLALVGAYALVSKKFFARKPILQHSAVNVPVSPETKLPHQTNGLNLLLKSLNQTEAQVMTFLLSQTLPLRASKIRHELKIPKTSLFRSLRSLEQKSILYLERDSKNVKIHFTD